MIALSEFYLKLVTPGLWKTSEKKEINSSWLCCWQSKEVCWDAAPELQFLKGSVKTVQEEHEKAAIPVGGRTVCRAARWLCAGLARARQSLSRNDKSRETPLYSNEQLLIFLYSHQVPPQRTTVLLNPTTLFRHSQWPKVCSTFGLWRACPAPFHPPPYSHISLSVFGSNLWRS